MGENISTIPINDIFEPKSGCPFCRAYSILEKRSIEYILGGAMMQPEIRIKTNETGFCKKHYKKMVGTGNRLQNALLLQSHMKYISQNVINNVKANKKSENQAKQSLIKVNYGCYICERIKYSMLHFMKALNCFFHNRSFSVCRITKCLLILPTHQVSLKRKKRYSSMRLHEYAITISVQNARI